MNYSQKIQRLGAHGTILILGLAVLTALAQPVAAQGSRGRTITCASANFQRTYCNTDTRSGVSLIRQLSDDRCEQGSTWGFTARGIWVDRGCRAEFALYYRASGANWDNQRQRFSQLDQGTVIPIRTDQYINSERSDGRIYTGTVAKDVVDDNRHLATPPGPTPELIVR